MKNEVTKQLDEILDELAKSTTKYADYHDISLDESYEDMRMEFFPNVFAILKNEVMAKIKK